MISNFKSRDIDTDVGKLMTRLKVEATRYRVRDSMSPNRGIELSDSAPNFGNRTADLPRADTQTEDAGIPVSIHLTLVEPRENVELPSFANGNWKLKDLLRYQDRAFIHAIYWAVLSRAPDEGGLDRY